MLIEKLEKKLQWEIINEYNIKQGVSVSFRKVTLNETQENHFEGVVQCAEPSHKWELSLIVKVAGTHVEWQLNELDWFKFELIEETKDLEKLTQAAFVHEDKGDFQGARDQFQAIELFSQKYGDKEHLAFSTLSQAWISLHKLNDPDTAFKKYQDSEKICKAINDSKKMKLILHDLAYLLLKNGENENAQWKYAEYKGKTKNDKLFEKLDNEVFADIIENTTEVKSPVLERQIIQYDELKELDIWFEKATSRISILWAKAMSAAGDKKYEEAIPYMDEYIGLNYAIGDRKKVMGGFANIGVFNYNVGNYDRALEMFEGQEKYAGSLGDKESLRQSLSNQASILRYKLEKYEEAIVKYTEAHSLYMELGDKKGLMDSLQNLVWIHYEKSGDYESAYNESKELEKLAREEKNNDLIIFCLQYQYDILKEWGEKKEAKILKKELDSIKK